VKLRHISVLGGLLLSIAIFAGHLLFSNHVIRDGFSELEQQHVLHVLDSARHELQNRLKQLDSTVNDWATWDDTYAYVRDRNDEYRNSNLPDETFESLELCSIIIRDIDGEVIFARAMSSKQRDETSLLTNLLRLNADDLPAIEDGKGGKGGIIYAAGDYHMVVSRPILTSEGLGPQRGTLVMVRPVTPEMVEDIGKGIGHPVRLSPPGDGSATGDRETVVNKDDNTAVGVGPLETLDGPRGILRVYVDRDMTAYGGKVATYNSIGIALAMIVFCLLAYLLLHFKVFRRLEALDTQIAVIRQKPDSAATVTAHGTDEIATLADSFNGLLEEIHSSHREQMAQAAEIASNERFLHQIMDSLSVGILLIRPKDRTILTINKHALELAGRTKEEIVGKVCHKLTCPAEINQCPILDRKQPEDLSRRELLTASGGSIPIMKSVAYVERNGEQLLLETIVDISEIERSRRELEKVKEGLEATVAARTSELAKANEDLIVLDKAKTLFLSSASHELRTPLTSILGFVKLMEKRFANSFSPVLSADESLAPRVRQFSENLSVVRGEAERLGRLVNDLLDLNKIESGSMEWRDAPLDMAALLTNVAEVFAGQAAEKPTVAFAVDPAPEQLTIMADPDRILQVLINLLNNAFKFTERGEVRLSVVPDGEFAQFRVKDTGRGIPAEDVEQVFDIFYQVWDETMRDSRQFGTGLGLAICRQIVSHYGGIIRVESEPGVGSTFLFTIPRMKPDDA